MNIWAVCCFFSYNPSHFRTRNYKIFRKQLKNHDVKLLTVEFNPDSRFELKEGEDAEVLIQLSQGDIMWQKERLLNIGIDKLPSDTDIVLVLDADIIFAHRNMVDRIKEAIQQYKVVQCYSHTMQLNPLFCIDPDRIDFFNIDNSKKYFFHDVDDNSFLYNFICSDNKQDGRMGLAWAYRYETIKQIKLFDRNIIGSGDNATMAALLRIFRRNVLYGTTNSWFPYADMIRSYVEVEDVNFLKDTMVYSLYHGEIFNKHYVKRHELLDRYNFDSSKHLIAEDGLPFRFTADVDPKLIEEIKQYFINRKENESLPF